MQNPLTKMFGRRVSSWTLLLVLSGCSPGAINPGDLLNSFGIGTPSGLVAEPGDSVVALSWTSVDPDTSYSVLRSTNASGPFTPIASNLTALTYEDRAAINGVTYYYQILATLRSSSEGIPTAVKSATPIAPPSGLTYTPSSLSLTKNTALSSNAVLSNAGGTIARCTVSPALPSGLSLSGTDCSVSGTPSVISASAVYTITATNAGGSSMATLSISVKDLNPVISYPGSPLAATINQSFSSSATLSGGAITGCTVSPALPTGLSLSSSTCAISGTPTVLSTNATYTVSATSFGGGTGSATFDLSVVDVPPSAINFAGAPFTFTKGVAITPVSSTHTGGDIAACSASGLPGGISVGVAAGECQISGTPTAATASATYTLSVSNSGGSASSASVTFSVDDSVPAAPSSVNVTGGNTQNTISWSSVSNATSYTVKTGPTGGPYSTTVTCSSSTSTSCTQTGLTNGTAYYYVVIANNASGAGAASSEATGTPVAPASKLVFTQQPSSTATAGSALGTQPKVSVENSANTVMTSATDTVLIMAFSDPSCSTPVATARDGSTATLGGTSSIAAVSGVATFTNLQLTRSGTIYLKATSGSLTSDCSAGVSVSPGAVSLSATTLALSASSVASGLAVTATLTGYDDYKNPNPSGISTRAFQTVSSGGTAALGAINDVGSGVYTVNVTGVVAGNLSVQATFNGSGVTETQTLTVTNSTATKLTFTTQPSSTITAGGTLSTQPAVSIQDSAGNMSGTETDSITVAAFSDSNCTTPVSKAPDGTSDTVSGTATKTAASGVATFSGIGLNRAGTIYLKATGGGYAAACSDAITVSPSAVSTSVSTFAVSSNSVNTGSVVNLTFTAYDAYKNSNPSGVTSVSFEKASGTGTGTLSSATNSSGVYTGTLTATGAGSYVVRTVLNSVNFASTQSITISTPVTTKIAFTVQPPSTATVDVALTSFSVAFEDANDNVMTGTNDRIYLYAYSDANCTTVLDYAPDGMSNAIGGTTSKFATSGVASFGSVKLYSASRIYIKADSLFYGSACSTAIDVSPGVSSKSGSVYSVSTNTISTGGVVNLTLTTKDSYGNPNPSVTSVAFAANSGTAQTFSSATHIGNGVYTGTMTGTNAGSTVTKAVIDGFDVSGWQTITVSGGTPTKLAFSVQPGPGNAVTPFNPQPQVLVQDSGGATVSNAADIIALKAYVDSSCTSPYAALTRPNPLWFVLGESWMNLWFKPSLAGVPVCDTRTTNCTQQASSGVAVFSFASASAIRGVTTVYLKATSGSLTSACSQAVTISP